MNATRIKWAIVALTLFALIGISLFIAPGANAAGPTINLPAFPVSATYTADPTNTFFSSVVLHGVGSGYDVKDNTAYTGWCVERLSGPAPDGGTYTVTLYSTYDPSLPANLTKWGTRVIPWDQINYLLNHKQTAAASDIARAIWDLIEGTPSSLPIEQDAIAHGTGFVPSPGQVVAVLTTNGSGIKSTGDTWQENIIEVPVPFPTAVTLSSFSATSSDNNSTVLNLGIPGLALGLLGLVVGAKVNKRRSRRI